MNPALQHESRQGHQTVPLVFYSLPTWLKKKIHFKNELDETVKVINLLKFRLSHTPGFFLSEIGSLHKRSCHCILKYHSCLRASTVSVVSGTNRFNMEHHFLFERTTDR